MAVADGLNDILKQKVVTKAWNKIQESKRKKRVRKKGRKKDRDRDRERNKRPTRLVMLLKS